MISTVRSSELARYGAVSVVGAVLDFAVGWGLSAMAGVPLLLAAAIGFALAAMLNYLLHEKWTFARPGNAFSLSRGAIYAASLLIVLGVRLTVITALSSLFQPSALQEGLVLLIAIGASFTVNYFISRLLFRPRGS